MDRVLVRHERLNEKGKYEVIKESEATFINDTGSRDKAEKINRLVSSILILLYSAF